jgi:hypothetical protein
MTNRELITAALRMLSVVDSNDTTASAEDAALGLDELNALMLELEAEGIDLGFPPQTNVSDQFPLGDREAAAIKPILAVQLFTHFPSANLPQTLPARAEASMQRLRRDAVLENMEEASMSNLPGGSGRCNGYNILTGE